MTPEERLAEITSSIDELGGLESFKRATHDYVLTFCVSTLRFEQYLTMTGLSECMFAYDPFNGKVTWGQQTFDAELIGSFGNTDWLWSKGSPFISLDERVTSINRAVRENPLHPVFSSPATDFGNTIDIEDLTQRLGGVCVASGAVHCQCFGGNQVYGFLPGAIEDFSLLDGKVIPLLFSGIDWSYVTGRALDIMCDRFGFPIIRKTCGERVVKFNYGTVSFDPES